MVEIALIYEELKRQKEKIEAQMNDVHKQAVAFLVAEFEQKHGLTKGCKVKCDDEVFFYDCVDTDHIRPFGEYCSGVRYITVRKIKKNGEPYLGTVSIVASLVNMEVLNG